VNIRLVISRVGLLFVLLSVAMVAVATVFLVIEWSLEHDVHPTAIAALYISGGICFLIGGFMWFAARKCPQFLGRREAMLLVALSWIGGAALAGMPFYIWAQMHFEPDQVHPFASYVDCYFEAMSGLTTTGATVLSDIEAVPRSLLLWRAFTQWLGGLGIVVLFVAVLPSLGVGGKRLFAIEAPGPTQEGLRPHVRETARVLLFIYLALTAIEIVALWLTPQMDLFDAACQTFTTIATAGFSNKNASVGAFDSALVNTIIIVFMVLSGINFGLYYQLIRGKGKNIFGNVELRLYLILLAVASLLIVATLWSSSSDIELTTRAEVPSSFGESVEQGVFTAVSIQTTTGFCTSNFNTWPFLAQAVLIMLMFVGGSAGSTSGGIKVIRIWIAFKVMLAEIERMFRPKVVRPVRVGGGTIDDDLKLGTLAYVLGIIILFIVGAGVLMLLENGNCDFKTASTASLATLCTIGPGLGAVGPLGNYGDFSGPSKVVMSMLMALGRLEVFAIIVLLTPRFWKGS
jgi:trk system potassium uptake protein TrkH